MSNPEAAVAIVHAQAEDSVLLIRRSERADDPWSGHWSLPGGRRDPEDPGLLHTALRELAEECGIVLAPAELEQALPHTAARRRAGPYVVVAPFVFRVARELPAVLDPREAVDSIWISRAVLLDPLRHCLRSVPGMPGHLYFPAIELDHVPLWGFTYRLLSDWLAAGPPAGGAGSETACRVLEFLLAQGLRIERGWSEQGGARLAAVKGSIPVGAVLEQFCRPGAAAVAVNCLEVRPDRIRIVGPAFEEYVVEGKD